LVLNPTVEQMERSRLNLTIAGTKDAVLMIEGAADFLPEALMIEAVSFGHDAVKVQCEGLEALGAAVGKEKRYDTIPPPVYGLDEQMVEMFSDKVDQLFDFTAKKEELSDATSKLSKEAKAYFEDIFPEQGTAVKAALKALLCKRMFAKAKESGKRVDGRNLDEVRQIDADA
jgi:polyribonucleotide nucleotidyltransferase